MSLTANAEGRVSGQFTIPEGIPAGTKLVRFEGGATQAAAAFVGRGTLKVEDLRVVNTKINRRTFRSGVGGRSGDPLAQTFILAERQQVAALDLWFTAKGTTPVLVQIRDVVLGLPADDVVTEALLAPADIAVDSWTRFKFTPAILEANQEYALVIACNDAIATVAVAAIGEFDATAQQWVSAQPYQVGVLLSSSNNRTWTAHQTHDLTFRLLACDYNETYNEVESGATRKVVTLEPQTVSNADHLMVMAAVERPTADCDVVFNVTVEDTLYTVLEGQPFTLAERYSGEVGLEAVLTGTFRASPTLYPDIHLIAGTRLSSCDYITRAIATNIGLAPSVKITVYFDVWLPDTASVTANYESEPGIWAALPSVANTDLGDGWQEIKCEQTDVTSLETRIKLILTGTAWRRPRVKNLRVAIS
jgi:hypothetical protein